MHHEAIKTEYLRYLMCRVGLEADGCRGYLRLCETLQEENFIPMVMLDENRCDECRELRSDFAEVEYGINGADTPETIEATDILDGTLCENGTMFELLIVLAEKIAYEMSDSEFEASTRKWFLEMIGNCGMDRYCYNENFEQEGNEENIRDIAHTVIFHKTGWDGEGGLFPLSYPQGDQRRVDFITQINNYLEENYDILR